MMLMGRNMVLEMEVKISCNMLNIKALKTTCIRNEIKLKCIEFRFGFLIKKNVRTKLDFYAYD